MKDLILVHSDRYIDWRLNPAHPTTGQRYTYAYDYLTSECPDFGISLEVVAPERLGVRELLETIHDPAYVASVLDEQVSAQWDGVNPLLAGLAETFASGTVVALELLQTGRTLTAAHLAGAKHHAHFDHSSGFCVFADFALAAKLETERGGKVAILDFDIHHGDGTEALTAANPNVLTFSIHRGDFFPGTGHESDPDKHVYNRPLRPEESTGEMLVDLVREFTELATDFGATMLFIAAGADGHQIDPMIGSGFFRHENGEPIGWLTADYRAAMQEVRRAFPVTPILIGGAGGYSPTESTPRVWADVAMQLAAGANWQKPGSATSSL